MEPINSESPDAGENPNAAPRTRVPSPKSTSPSTNGWRERAVTWMLMIALLPIVYGWGCREIARWYTAASTDAQYRGQYELALARSQKAIEWDPGNPNYLSDQSHLLLRLANAKDACVAADQLLTTRREAVDSQPSTHNTRFLIQALNGSAYAHALDHSELTKAWQDADEALSLCDQLPVNERPVRAGIMDTRGYLRYLLADQNLSEFIAEEPGEESGNESEADAQEGIDEKEKDESEETIVAEKENVSASKLTGEELRIKNLQAALVDLNAAVEQNERLVRIQKDGIATLALKTIDHLPLRYQRLGLDENMAVLYQHRGLVRKALGETASGKEDLRRADRLGFDPANGIWSAWRIVV